jgi:biopolymer transport protein TolQ
MFIPSLATTSGILLLSDLWSLLRQAGPAARVILLILAVFSVLSWAVMWDRWRVVRGAERETDRYLELFRSAQSLNQVREQGEAYALTPLARIFRNGYQELAQAAPRRGEPQPTEALREIGLRNVDRALGRAAREESARLERGLGFLATTASVTPFIGLLGTVWGIMNAFQGIGRSGSASLAVVAPGIAEALINTAAGLAAAIPAVLGYNHFLGRLRRLGVRMENFSSEFAARADRILGQR